VGVAAPERATASALAHPGSFHLAGKEHVPSKSKLSALVAAAQAVQVWIERA
jgi:hypothetical protein